MTHDRAAPAPESRAGVALFAAALCTAALGTAALTIAAGAALPASSHAALSPEPMAAGGAVARASRTGGPLESYGLVERRQRPRYA